jgi:hypothetical protein
MQKDAGHTMELLKVLPGDVTLDIFKAFTAHITDITGPWVGRGGGDKEGVREDSEGGA